MTDTPITAEPERRRGQVIFNLVFLGLSILLLALIGEQTEWKQRTKLFAQPAFWPAVALTVMVIFSAFRFYLLKRRWVDAADLREARNWAYPFEYAVWFMAYVGAVPVIGFLPTSMIFCPLLTWRLGYRDKRMLAISILFAVMVVVVFKSLLSVRIPGGLIYEWLPGALRSFAIVNL